jgi:hypothetical protein
MIAAWGIQELSNVEKIGDYTFRLEFGKEEGGGGGPGDPKETP